MMVLMPIFLAFPGNQGILAGKILDAGHRHNLRFNFKQGLVLPDTSKLTRVGIFSRSHMGA